MASTSSWRRRKTVRARWASAVRLIYKPLSLSPILFAGLLLAQNVFNDPKQPVEARADDLVKKMTLEEKASQLLSQSPAIDRLGVPAYDWWNECLHGVARAGRATVFPETIGMAATWDTDLLFRVATAISDEARAKNNDFVRRGKRGIYEGLTFWTPNINIFRDPRWGRGMETYGEDPFLTGQMATQFIRGLQGDDPKYLKVVATAKHYAVHSGPESTRHVADVRADARDLHDTYLPQFEMAVKDGGANSVMCAYNRVDGLPACANAPLLQNILRDEWHFPGYVVSDCGAIGDIYKTHKTAKTADEGVAMAIRAGTDLDCGLEYRNVPSAVRKEFLNEEEVNRAVRRLVIARLRLGMFDPPEQVRWSQIPLSVNESKEHQALALETARKSVVLLKNEGGVLPLKKDLKTIAVIGPNADSVESLLGNYNGQPSQPVTPLAGIRAKLASDAKILYARGTDFAPGLPSLETVPASALFTSAGADRKPGLHGAYFNTSNFNGQAYVPRAFVSPDMRPAVTNPRNLKDVFTRTDAQIDFDWRDRSPRSDLDDDNFGVRWTGVIVPPVSGRYQLGAVGLNSFELYLDGQVIARRDNVHERGYEYEAVDLVAGKPYPLQLDFHEVHGDADIRLVWEAPHADLANEALKVAQQSDAVLMFLGLSPRLEGEEMKVKVDGFNGGDRVKLAIPQVQEDLLRRVSALGKPVVLVLLNGSAVAVNWARDHVPAIVELWYPGQAGGTALADVLFGDYNPAGRLPVTFYRSENDLPHFDDYNMKGRTYRYFEGKPLFGFGYGLSYTSFEYKQLNVPATVHSGDNLKVAVNVTNTGQRAGEEVAQLYLKHVGAQNPMPLRSLVGFRRISLKPGETQTITFTVSPRELAEVSADGRRSVQPGKIELTAGGGQPQMAASNTLAAQLQIEGSTAPVP